MYEEGVLGEKMMKDFATLTTSPDIRLKSSRVLLNNIQDSGVALKKNSASSAKCDLSLGRAYLSLCSEWFQWIEDATSYERELPCTI